MDDAGDRTLQGNGRLPDAHDGGRAALLHPDLRPRYRPSCDSFINIGVSAAETFRTRAISPERRWSRVWTGWVSVAGGVIAVPRRRRKRRCSQATVKAHVLYVRASYLW